jgi:hypothetical protein
MFQLGRLDFAEAFLKRSFFLRVFCLQSLGLTIIHNDGKIVTTIVVTKDRYDDSY